MPTAYDTDPYADEPYGAQVLRRMHADDAGQLEEFDDMMPYMEDDQARDELAEKCYGLVKSMERIERVWFNHPRYKLLPPLDRTDDDDQFDAVLGAAADDFQDEENLKEDRDRASHRKMVTKAIGDF